MAAVTLRSATIYPLDIPFVVSFAHSRKRRSSCDSVVVRLEASDGTVGYGEAAPRPYVTGETVDSVVSYVSDVAWPNLLGVPLPDPEGDDLLRAVDGLLLDGDSNGVVAHHAARGAVEVALLDCLLRMAKRPLCDLLHAEREELVYGGVVGAGSFEQAIRHTRLMKAAALGNLKVKVGQDDEIERVGTIREIVGDGVSLRIDANEVWTPDQAIKHLQDLAPFGIEAAEQPVHRRDTRHLPALRAESPIPIMVDESLVTMDDAKRLTDSGGCDLFNIRISKCGGIGRSLALAEHARTHGLGFQIGAHVGETAILSAAGRHLATHLGDARWIEGSWGPLLLEADVASDSPRFGHGGRALPITGPGLGIDVRDEILSEKATRSVVLGEVTK